MTLHFPPALCFLPRWTQRNLPGTTPEHWAITHTYAVPIKIPHMVIIMMMMMMMMMMIIIMHGTARGPQLQLRQNTSSYTATPMQRFNSSLHSTDTAGPLPSPTGVWGTAAGGTGTDVGDYQDHTATESATKGFLQLLLQLRKCDKYALQCCSKCYMQTHAQCVCGRGSDGGGHFSPFYRI